MVQNLQSKCRGCGGCEEKGEEGQESEVDIPEEAEARSGECAEDCYAIPEGSGWFEDGREGQEGKEVDWLFEISGTEECDIRCIICESIGDIIEGCRLQKLYQWHSSKPVASAIPLSYFFSFIALN